MSAVHPELLWLGVLLAVIPVAIHWLARPKPRAVPFSAMRFLLAVDGDRRRAHRLRDWLVLVARTLAVICVAFAIARPRASMILLPDGSLDRVVVLDVSQSMGARAGGTSAFELARVRALEKLRGPVGTRYGLVLAGALAQPAFPELSAHVGPLRREVTEAAVRPEAVDVAAALAAAQQLLGAARAGRAREIVVVTDLQRSSWESLSPAPLEAGVVLSFELVAPARPPRNLAVSAVRPGASASTGVRPPAVVAVEVFNGSPLPVEARVELSVGQQRWQQPLKVAAWAAAQASFPVPRAAGDAGAFLSGSARVVAADDDLPADDARPFAWSEEAGAAVAVVSAQSSQRLKTSPDYLARALAAGGDGRRVERLAPVDLAAAAAHDVVWLVRPGPLDDAALATLYARASGGAGLVYVAEEAADCQNLRRLAERIWPGRGTGADSAAAHTLVAWSGLAAPIETSLGRVDATRRPFKNLGPRLCEALALAPLRTGVRAARPSGAAVTEVLAELADGSPVLTQVPVGRGGVLVLGLDLAGSPLTRGALFVPLIEEVLAMARFRTAEASAEIACGRPASLSLAARPGGPRPVLAGPEGNVADARLTDDSGDARIAWRALAPGVYEVRSGERLLAQAAVACPGAEADLRPASTDEVARRARDGGRGVRVSQGAGTEDGLLLWPWLALAAALMCCAELGLLLAFH